MAADEGYRDLYEEFRKRGDFGEVFGAALDDVAGEVDLGRVRSCVALGAGSGDRETEFARRLLPNLRSFTAVEPDQASADALRTNLQVAMRAPSAVFTCTGALGTSQPQSLKNRAWRHGRVLGK